MDSPRIARSVDKFEVREEHSGHKYEGYLNTGLCSKLDRCKEERPEDSKQHAIGVGEVKHAHFCLERGTRVCAFRGDLQRDRTRAQSAVPSRTVGTLDHASIVRVRLRSMNVKYSYAPHDSSHSRSQHAEPVINAEGRM